MAAFVERTSRGFLSNIFNSFVGVLIGFLFIPASICLIGWNEYRTVHRAKGLLEGEAIVEPLGNLESIDPSKTGKLVHAIGLATTDEVLAETEFGVVGNFLRLKREVQMYQWVEKQESKTKKKLGGGEETVRTYSYDKQWRTGREKSEEYRESSKHVNPQPRFTSNDSVSSHVTLGAFTLRPEQVQEINSWKEQPLNEAVLIEKFDSETQAKFKVEGGFLYFRSNPTSEAPQVGDIRIRFEAVDPTQISLLGKQDQSSFAAFQTSNGETIDSLMVGQVTASQMFAALKTENTILAIVLRAVGWILSIVGFSLITGPLKALSNIIPFLGNMVGAATFFVSLILGSCVSLIAISVAWIAVRPLYSIVLLAFVGLGIYVLWRRRTKPGQSELQELPMATLVDH